MRTQNGAINWLSKAQPYHCGIVRSLVVVRRMAIVRGYERPESTCAFVKNKTARQEVLSQNRVSRPSSPLLLDRRLIASPRGQSKYKSNTARRVLFCRQCDDLFSNSFFFLEHIRVRADDYRLTDLVLYRGATSPLFNVAKANGAARGVERLLVRELEAQGQV